MSTLKLGEVVFGVGFDDAEIKEFEAALKRLSAPVNVPVKIQAPPQGSAPATGGSAANASSLAAEIAKLRNEASGLSSQFRATGAGSDELRAKLEQIKATALLVASSASNASAEFRASSAAAAQASIALSRLDAASQTGSASLDAQAQAAQGLGSALSSVLPIPPALEQSLNGISNAFSQSSSASAGFGAALSVVGSALAGAALAVGVGKIKEFAEDSDRARIAGLVFSETLKSQGRSAEEAAALVTRLGKTYKVLESDIQNAISPLLRLGLTLPQIEQALSGGASSALAFGRDARRGFEGVSQALVSEQSIFFNQIGISQNLSTASENLAKELKKTTTELTTLEKASAGVNLVLNATREEVALTSVLTSGLVSRQGELTAATIGAQRALGLIFIPAVSAGISALTALAAATQSAALGFSSAQPAIVGLGAALTTLGALVAASSAVGIAGGFVNLVSKIQAVGSVGIAVFAANAPLILGVVALTASVGAAAAALQSLFDDFKKVDDQARQSAIINSQVKSSGTSAAKTTVAKNDAQAELDQQIKAKSDLAKKLQEVRSNPILSPIQSPGIESQIAELEILIKTNQAYIKSLDSRLVIEKSELTSSAERIKFQQALASSASSQSAAFKKAFEAAGILSQKLREATGSLDPERINKATNDIESFTKKSAINAQALSIYNQILAETKNREEAAERATREQTKAREALAEKTFELNRALKTLRDSLAADLKIGKISDQDILKAQIAIQKLKEDSGKSGIRLDLDVSSSAESILKIATNINAGRAASTAFLNGELKSLQGRLSDLGKTGTLTSSELDGIKNVLSNLQSRAEGLGLTLDSKLVKQLQKSISYSADAVKANDALAASYRLAAAGAAAAEEILSARFSRLGDATLSAVSITEGAFSSYDDAIAKLINLKIDPTDPVLAKALEQRFLFATEASKKAFRSALSGLPDYLKESIESGLRSDSAIDVSNLAFLSPEVAQGLIVAARNLGTSAGSAFATALEKTSAGLISAPSVELSSQSRTNPADFNSLLSIDADLASGGVRDVEKALVELAVASTDPALKEWADELSVKLNALRTYIDPVTQKTIGLTAAFFDAGGAARETADIAKASFDLGRIGADEYEASVKKVQIALRAQIDTGLLSADAIQKNSNEIKAYDNTLEALSKNRTSSNSLPAPEKVNALLSIDADLASGGVRDVEKALVELAVASTDPALKEWVDELSVKLNALRTYIDPVTQKTIGLTAAFFDAGGAARETADIAKASFDLGRIGADEYEASVKKVQIALRAQIDAGLLSADAIQKNSNEIKAYDNTLEALSKNRIKNLASEAIATIAQISTIGKALADAKNNQSTGDAIRTATNVASAIGSIVGAATGVPFIGEIIGSLGNLTAGIVDFFDAAGAAGRKFAENLGGSLLSAITGAITESAKSGSLDELSGKISGLIGAQVFSAIVQSIVKVAVLDGVLKPALEALGKAIQSGSEQEQGRALDAFVSASEKAGKVIDGLAPKFANIASSLGILGEKSETAPKVAKAPIFSISASGGSIQASISSDNKRIFEGFSISVSIFRDSTIRFQSSVDSFAALVKSTSSSSGALRYNG